MCPIVIETLKCRPPQLSDLFVTFEENPQGAASLAQVHKAVLRDGRTVAVKVQHPKVQAQSSQDIVLMEVCVALVRLQHYQRCVQVRGGHWALEGRVLF